MKAFLSALLLLPASAAHAQVAQPPAAPTVAAPAGTVMNGDTPIEVIAAVPAGKAALAKRMPGVLDHPAYEQFKGMSLRQLAPLSGGLINDEKIASLEADLKSSK